MNAKIFLFIIAIAISAIFSQVERTITGKIIDEEGEAITGAIVKVKEYPEIATITDIDGNYILSKIPEEAKILIFSFAGMETEEVKIRKNEVINVTLKKSEEDFDDVEVTVSGISRTEKKVGFGHRKGRDKRTGLAPKYRKSTEKPVAYDRDEAFEYDITESISDKSSFDGEGDFGGETYGDNQIKSGQLTAGEIHDFSKWTLWQDISENELKQFTALWDFYPSQRYCVQLTSDDGKPIINSKVELQTQQGEIVWSSKTDNTGKAELWANMFDTTYTRNEQFIIQVDYQGNISSINEPTNFHDGINQLSISTTCDIPDKVDICFVVDATGSMGDEINYLQAELQDVITRVQKEYKDLTLNMGSVFYRDEGDDYLTVKSDFTSKKKDAIKFINDQTSGGGGDFPEAVHSGLDVAVNELQWSDDARTRIIFLVLDAPPHNTPEVIEELQNLSKVASEKGIRIVPVTCSGIDKSTEYLMRSMALCTNGTYVFLTDDSGIGGSHIKPTTDKFEVEKFNDLLVRLITQYVTTPTCSNEVDFTKDEISDTTYVITPDTNFVIMPDTAVNIVDSSLVNVTDTTDTKTDIIPYNYDEGVKFYPNPTRGQLFIEISGEIKQLFLADNSGKILQRFVLDGTQKFELFIGDYPSGMYFIQYLNKDKWMSGKIILMH